MKGNMIFATRIKQLREASGESQADLGKLVGYGKQAVSHWENNGKVPRTPALETLAKHFQTSIDYLLGFETERAQEVKEAPVFSTDEQWMLKKYRGLEKEQKVMIQKIMEAIGSYEVNVDK